MISGDGRYVAFVSSATNLVAGDTNGQSDIFVRDRRRAATVRVSVSTGGGEATNRSIHPTISDDGNLVAFTSLASEPGDRRHQRHRRRLRPQPHDGRDRAG